MKKVLAIFLYFLGTAFAQTADDNIVVVGNQAQPVQWTHQNSIQAAINRAGASGIVWIPGSYTGTDCNPLSTCDSIGALIIDLRGGTFVTYPPLAGNVNFAGDLSGNNLSQAVIGIDTVPLCTGYTPTPGGTLQYTTSSTPNPCYQSATANGNVTGSGAPPFLAAWTSQGLGSFALAPSTGTCSMSSGTTCSTPSTGAGSLGTSYGTPYFCWAQDATAGTQAKGCTVSGNIASLTANSSNSDTWNVFVLGTVAVSPTGPPLYLGTPSNIGSALAPTQIPFSGLGTSSTGVDNTLVSDPEPVGTGNTSGLYHNPITRITNSQTACGANNEAACSSYGLNTAFTVDSSGSEEVQHFNTDSTMFDIADQNNWVYFYSLNTSTQQATFKYTNRAGAGVTGICMYTTPVWSTVNNHTMFWTANSGCTGVGTYLYESTTLNNNYPTLPTYSSVLDLSFGGQAFPSTATAASDPLTVVNSDNNIIVGWAIPGNLARYAMFYNVSSDTIYIWNTSVATNNYTVCSNHNSPSCSTTTVQCQNCGTGITNPGTFTIHNVKGSRAGNFVTVTPETCDSGSTCYFSVGEYLFIPTTGAVWTSCPAGTGPGCGGHQASGASGLVQDYNRNTLSYRAVTSGLSTPANVPSTAPCSYPNQTQDQHLTWLYNPSFLDQSPTFFSTSSETVAPDYTNCWTNEIIGLWMPSNSSLNGTYKRFGHNYTAPTACFGGQIAVGAISQDGDWFLSTSTMGGGLGSVNGSASCTPATTGSCLSTATNCRADVFLYKLQ